MIDKLICEGYINSVKHPTDELFIYNYTAKAQYENKWLEYPEIRKYRGLILDSNGNLVGKSFDKFHNIEEYSDNGILGPLPSYSSFEVYDKLDGSLGISYKYSGGVAIATRGSFTSDQSLWATSYLNKKYPNFDPPDDLTFLFEILYKENRIVVDYDYERLVLLSIFRKEQELSREEIENISREYNFELVEKFSGIEDFNNIRNIYARDNAEGFVIKFDNGLRVKLKYEEYRRLHKIVTGINSKIIWEMLKEDKNFEEILDRVPDEFYDWVKHTKNIVQEKYENIMKLAENKKEIIKNLSRKQQAERILQDCNRYSGVVFSLLDNRYDKAKEISWKLSRPENDTPFRNKQ